MRAFILAALGNSVAVAQWQQQAIETDADFRGLSAVGPNVARVSGRKGTFGRTADGGKTWSVGTVPDAEKLDFGDVEAFSEETAYLLSGGPAKTHASTRRMAGRPGNSSSRTLNPRHSSTPLPSGTRNTGSRSVTPWTGRIARFVKVDE